jgi:hypothetical protein
VLVVLIELDWVGLVWSGRVGSGKTTDLLMERNDRDGAFGLDGRDTEIMMDNDRLRSRGG